jgi:hypothetical protein
MRIDMLVNFDLCTVTCWMDAISANFIISEEMSSFVSEKFNYKRTVSAPFSFEDLKGLIIT